MSSSLHAANVTTRRHILRRLVLGTTLAAAGGLAWRAADTGVIGPLSPDPLEAWAALELPGPASLRIARAGILSANAHNTQPWRLRVEDEAIDVLVDEARNIGAFDPFRREQWQSLGCLIETMAVFAPEVGRQAHVTLLPDGSGPRAARLDLLPVPAAASDLSRAIRQRHTERAPFADKAVAPEQLAALAALADEPALRLTLIPADATAGGLFARGSVEATKAIIADPDMTGASHHWMRNSPRAVAQHRDGISTATAGLSPVMTIIAQLLPEPSPEMVGDYWVGGTEQALAASAAFGLIQVADLDDRRGQLAVGRLWQRLHLHLTVAGLVAQPLNQMAEMVDRDRATGQSRGWAEKLAAIGGDPAWHPSFLFRLGHPARTAPASARRPLEMVLVT